MPTNACPKGHESADSDFCSVCGVKMQPARAAAAPPAPAIPSIPIGDTCPDCGAKREASGGAFCEICGFNFTTGAHGELKPALQQTSVADPAPLIAAAEPAVKSWELEVAVDPSLRAPDSPEPPADVATARYTLLKESSLVGRVSDRRGVFPEIPLDFDDAVSHRHALLNRTPEGGLVVRDIGSSNGTRLNGVDVQPLTDMPLKDGDEFTLGHWTRVKVRIVQ